jgi:hypothetical protein
MSQPLTDFEEGMAAAIAKYVSHFQQRFFQKDKWFSLSCEFRLNKDGTTNVSDISVEPTSNPGGGK